LINHLKSQRIFAKREKDVSEIPLLRISNATSIRERIEAIIEFLKARGASKPRAIKTLTSSIDSLFMKKLEESELSDLIRELVERKLVMINGTKVSYYLPK
jgi:lipoate-protein ligase A